MVLLNYKIKLLALGRAFGWNTDTKSSPHLLDEDELDENRFFAASCIEINSTSF